MLKSDGRIASIFLQFAKTITKEKHQTKLVGTRTTEKGRKVSKDSLVHRLSVVIRTTDNNRYIGFQL